MRAIGNASLAIRHCQGKDFIRVAEYYNTKAGLLLALVNASPAKQGQNAERTKEARRLYAEARDRELQTKQVDFPLARTYMGLARIEAADPAVTDRKNLEDGIKVLRKIYPPAHPELQEALAFRDTVRVNDLEHRRQGNANIFTAAAVTIQKPWSQAVERQRAAAQGRIR